MFPKIQPSIFCEAGNRRNISITLIDLDCWCKRLIFGGDAWELVGSAEGLRFNDSPLALLRIG
jgi:hypothetical protein